MYEWLSELIAARFVGSNHAPRSVYPLPMIHQGRARRDGDAHIVERITMPAGSSSSDQAETLIGMMSKFVR